MIELQAQRVLWNRALVALAEKDRDPEPELTAFLVGGALQIGEHGLDIGCGLGRHTIAAIRFGYKMAAVDFSEVAVEKTKQLVRSEGFRADVRCSSMHDLPFDNAQFDFALSWCALNHGTQRVFERAISEAGRVLRSGGVLFGFVMSRRDSRFKSGLPIGRNCFAFTEGPEAGIHHYFPSEQRLVAALECFSVIETLEEVVFDGDENTFYHPEIRRSCHFQFVARKR